LNGLYDAKLDQAPVLTITGQTYSDLKGSNFQQEINLTLLFEDVSVYNQEVINPNQIEMLANEACRHALNNRGWRISPSRLTIRRKKLQGVGGNTPAIALTGYVRVERKDASAVGWLLYVCSQTN
jgi:pyruvate dehydrogenase (quinone)